jgi:EpsD family peptidyl-prolyl cis-trans isomerase
MKTSMRHRQTITGLVRLTVALGLCALALVGCGRKEQGAASKGQVVAHVGDEVVTTQELQNELRWANVSPDKQNDPTLLKQIIGELVLRKYLLQQALAEKLDREPGVLLDLLRARTQILATAYLSRKIGAKPIAQAEVDQYIASNPFKFAKRRLLVTEQIVFAYGPNSQGAVDMSKDAKSLDEVDQELTVMGVPHNRVTGTLNTGEIPQDFLKVIETKKADNVFFVRSGANGVFFVVKDEQQQPLQGEAAANAARQFIRAERMKAETEMASVSANLEAKYEGEYATIMTSKESGADGKK